MSGFRTLKESPELWAHESEFRFPIYHMELRDLDLDFDCDSWFWFTLGSDVWTMSKSRCWVWILDIGVHMFSNIGFGFGVLDFAFISSKIGGLLTHGPPVALVTVSCPGCFVVPSKPLFSLIASRVCSKVPRVSLFVSHCLGCRRKSWFQHPNSQQ